MFTTRPAAAARRPLHAAALLVACLSGVRPALPQSEAPQPSGAATEAPRDGHRSIEASNLYRLIRRFDFDERRLGNYENLPRGWQRLSGPGLPPHAVATFDEGQGAGAAPCFKLALAGGGNVAVEYGQADLTAVTHSDYVIAGAVRTEGLAHARALVVAYFVDRYGERVEGSTRISELVGSDEAAAGRWQPVRVELPGEFTRAASLRIQLWILQEYCWWRPDPNRPDPLLIQDVRATAWFDDLHVYRLPRARLRLSEPSGALEPGAAAQLFVEVSNATPFPLEAEVTVTQVASGQVVLRRRIEVPAEGDERAGVARAAAPLGGPLEGDAERGPQAVALDVPPLPAGIYRAEARLLNGTEALLERSVRFVSLPALPFKGQVKPEIGMDVGLLQPGDVAGLRRLILGLGCGAAKVSVPLAPLPATESFLAYFRRVAALARDLAENRVETTAVLLAPEALQGSREQASTRALLATGAGWKKQMAPVLAELGGLLSTWQLGDARVELRGGEAWSEGEVAEVREHLKRFVTLPQLVVPGDATREPAEAGDVFSILLPRGVATRNLPLQLEHVLAREKSERWIDIEPGASRGPDAVAELAQRVALLRALGAERIYLPPLATASTSGGDCAWEPGEAYVAMRTLLSAIGTRRITGVLTPAEHAIALLFERDGDDLAIIWSWESGDGARTAAMYLGPEPKAVDLYGRPVELPQEGGSVRVPLRACPLVVYNVSAALARVQSSFRLEPTSIQLHEAPRPVLELTNHFDAPMSGELHISGPVEWRVRPELIPFTIEPGETLRQELSMTLPPRQLASTEAIVVTVATRRPRAATLTFRTPISVRLSGLHVDAQARWEGDALIVEQTLENQGDAPVRFTGFCDAEGRPRQERAFLDVAPGEKRVQRFVLPAARDLAGSTLYLGVREIRGARRLEQLVDVPR